MRFALLLNKNLCSTWIFALFTKTICNLVQNVGMLDNHRHRSRSCLFVKVEITKLFVVFTNFFKLFWWTRFFSLTFVHRARSDQVPFSKYLWLSMWFQMRFGCSLKWADAWSPDFRWDRWIHIGVVRIAVALSFVWALRWVHWHFRVVVRWRILVFTERYCRKPPAYDYLFLQCDFAGVGVTCATSHVAH